MSDLGCCRQFTDKADRISGPLPTYEDISCLDERIDSLAFIEHGATGITDASHPDCGLFGLSRFEDHELT